MKFKAFSKGFKAFRCISWYLSLNIGFVIFVKLVVHWLYIFKHSDKWNAIIPSSVYKIFYRFINFFILSEQGSEMVCIKEQKLTIQSFHQYSSFVSTRLSENNFLVWKGQILPLIQSLGIEHHLRQSIPPPERIIDATVQPNQILIILCGLTMMGCLCHDCSVQWQKKLWAW